jgi:hypothetical protein
MKRDTLASFFQRVVIAVLPLAAGCEPSAHNCGTYIVDGGIGDLGCQTRCQTAGMSTPFCQEQLSDLGTPITECIIGCVTGRRPEGLARPEVQGSSLGAHFARMAHLEAASIPAFRRLRAELRAHGAPRRLLDACSRAARDEIRHARRTAQMARRFGAQPPRVELARADSRSLSSLAKENAREGCVRESFGALLATWQARAAADHDVRRLMEEIAVDETRHAELAWAIDAWLRGRLDARERAELNRVHHDELASLESELDGAVDPALAHAAGLPSDEVTRALAERFAAEVRRRLAS